MFGMFKLHFPLVMHLSIALNLNLKVRGGY